MLPEIVLGISLFLVFQHLLKFIELGTTAQILGLVTYQISYPFIIVRARLLTIGREYEEAATDLGARPRQAIRRVLLPLLYPAIFASAALVFADTIDDFVTVKYLSGPATTEPLSVKIYNFTRAEPDAGRQRGRDVPARHDDVRDRARVLRLPAGDQGPADRRRLRLRERLARDPPPARARSCRPGPGARRRVGAPTPGWP